MANLTPTPVWDQVPQLEEATIARAGPGGPMNTQAQALANRTEFLAQNALRFVRVRATSLTFYFPSTGGPTPGSITLTALVNGDLTGTPVFTVIAGTAVLMGTGDTRTLAAGDMLTDSVTITVSVGVYSDTITITKVRDGLQGAPGSAGPAGAPGSPGANASILALFPTALAFTYDKNGEPSPASQTITFNAQLANLAGTATFVCTLYDVSGTNIGAVGLGGSGNSRTLTIAQFGAAKYAVVEASLSGFSDRVTIIRLRDGENAVTGLLTNESVTLAASADGVVPSFAAAGGTFKVFDGTTDVTLVSGFSVVAETGADVSIVNNTGVYSVASMSADTATAILRAVYGTVTIDKVLTLAKSRAGAQGPAGVGSPGPQGDPGLNAQLLTLLSSSQSFRFDRNNAALPTDQTITFTAQLANLSGVATFVCTLYDGAGTSLGTVAMGGAGSNVRTLTAAQFGSAQYAVVTATLSGLSDQMTVVRVRDGSNALSGLLTNESVTLAANSSGGVSDFGPAGGTFRVFDGSNDVTTSSSFTVVTSSGATAFIGPSTGIYSVSAMPADTANVTLRATYNGVTIDKVLSLAKSRAGAQGAQGTPGTPGAPGSQGIRGSRSFYLTGYSAWNSAAATTAASVDGGPVLTDVVTQYSAGFAQTRFWNGSAWLEIAEVINGNLLVNGTVAAQAFVAGLMQSDNVLTRGLTVRDASGNIILGSGQALSQQYLRSSGLGGALNDDPNTEDVLSWIGGTLSVVADASAPNGRALEITSTGATTFNGRLIPIDPAKKYTARIYAKQQSGSSTCYLGVSFLDASGNLIQGIDSPAGWPSPGTYHYFGVAGVSLPGSFTPYEISFGAGESAGFPSGAKSARIVILGNYLGSGTQRFSKVSISERTPWQQIADRPSNLALLVGNEGIRNELISLSNSGQLLGAGGGQVTIGGLGYTGDLNATNGAQTGVNLRDNGGALLNESQLKNSAISITLNANGTLSVGGGPSASGAITLGGLGAGAFALLNQITSANISTYIAGAAIDLARINLATINNLAALSSLLGAVEIVAGGHLRSGQTGYATGNGFWLGWDGGEPALSIGGAAAYLRYKPSLGMQLKLDTFSASITGGNISVTNSSNLSPQGLGTRGISVSGGQAPYSYSWSISFNDPPIACTVYISGGSNLSSAAVVGDLASTAGGAFGQLQCSVTDSNGRVAFAAVSLAFTGSSYSP